MATGLWSELGRALRGPLGWVGRLAFAYILLFFGLMVWCAIELFAAEDTRDQILFAVGVVLTFLISALCKLYLYMLMNRNALEDRLERIEKRLETSASGSGS